MVIARRPLTLEEFLALPEEKPALEFEDGEVNQKVSPKLKHSMLQRKLCDFINGRFEERQLAMAFPELRCTFGGRSRVPDVAIIAWHQIPIDEDGELLEDFFAAPEITIEIVSPEQSTNSLVRRCMWFVANGVAAALLVDSVDRSILVFRPDQPPRAFRGDERIDLGGVFASLEMTPAELFGTLKIPGRKSDN